jgi:hypothetical protein
MSLLSKINFRQILVVFLVQITFFLGLALGSGNNTQAIAEVINRKSADFQSEQTMDDVDYESAKEKRRELQAERSKQASSDTNDETIQEKLNLDELVSSSSDDASNK